MAISPATGLYGDSSIGGTFGVELRQAGIDLLSVTGRAALSILLIDDGKALIPMPELAGKTSLEAEGMIKNRLGTHDVKIAVTGVAGENPSGSPASTPTGPATPAGPDGRDLGSKNIKAIVVRGNKDMPVHDMGVSWRRAERPTPTCAATSTSACGSAKA